MKTLSRRYIIGIDLGTTNSAVSYVDLSLKHISAKDIRIFSVPQFTGAGEISSLTVLPSFFYLPGKHEIQKEALELPWSSQEQGFVGAFARDQGANVPKRMVSSAKSWLCHGKVDRKAAILPWGADEEVQKVSPVTASSAYLRHIRDAWNHEHGYAEDLLLENQMVIITVPASFDEVARDLTVEAAAQAGIKNITLLEEPLAAFYRWLIVHEKDWDKYVRPGELILVCDVGGGTTDFTLVTLRDRDGSPVFDRIAVGDHLILGGDNMDLTLARTIEHRLQKADKGSLNIHRWQALCNQCRQAKEEILSDLAESKRITLVGEGRKLIADTVSTSLARQEIENVIIEGFFPFVAVDDTLSEKGRRGITEFGLEYAQDPAVTRHMFRFLRRHKEDILQILGRESLQPDLILFNGGALKPAIIQERIREVIRRYFNLDDQTLPRKMENPAHDLAVALGATYYGLVKQGHGVRVGSGSARSYFLGVAQAQKGREQERERKTAVCVVERGMEEGTTVELQDKEFHVLANQPVSFDLYSSSFRARDRIGDLVGVDDSLTPLPPIQTVIRFGRKAGQINIPVHVEASYTEVGTLALWCRSLQSTHRWRLQFQLRDIDQAKSVSDREVFEAALVEESQQRIQDVFGRTSSLLAPEQLTRIIADIVERPKEKWPLTFIRTMADQLLEMLEGRKRSNEHESLWLNLIGFCLRPGFGDALDEHRIQKLWKIFNDGPVYGRNVQARSEWWVLWRRVAGGLRAVQQRQVLLNMLSFIKPGKKGSSKTKLAPQEHIELWMALANMERLPVAEKISQGQMLLDELSPKKSRPQYWWALSRIAAREPLYGPIDLVVPPREVALWIRNILTKNWRNPRPVGTAVAHMARLTGDRKRDIDATVREEIVTWLSCYDWSEPHLRLVREVIPMDRQEETTVFGESLPAGIVLHLE